MEAEATGVDAQGERTGAETVVEFVVVGKRGAVGVVWVMEAAAQEELDRMEAVILVSVVQVMAELKAATLAVALAVAVATEVVVLVAVALVAVGMVVVELVGVAGVVYRAVGEGMQGNSQV